MPAIKILWPLVLLAFFATSARLLANIPGGSTGTGSNVMLVNNGNGTLTMSNGVVSILITVNGASVNQINYTYNNGTGTQTRQLLAGGKNGGQLYWEYGGYGNGGTWTSATVVNPATGDATHTAGDYAEVALTCNAAGSAPVGDLQVNFSMLRGSPGFYVTLTMKHHAGDVATGLGEMRTNIYTAPYFNWMSVNSTIQRELGINATYAAAFFAPQECSLCTSGVNQGVYDDKYKFCAYWGDERVWGWSSVNDSAHGVKSGTNVGIWYVLASSEYYNGGPLKPELMDAPMVNMLNGGHYYMGSDSSWTQNENWVRVQGPFFVYVNNVSSTLTDPIQTSQALYNDALAQGVAEASAWPYTWFNNATYDSNYAQAAQRGTVTGTMAINDSGNPNASAANMWVGVIQQTATSNGVVQQQATTDGVYDFQQWYKPYQFWVKTDAIGNFTIPNVIAGDNYTLYAFGPGAEGTFLSQNLNGGNPPWLYNLPATPFNVTVTGGATTTLGTVTWTPTRVGPTVFEIGYPDRTARKFRHGDDFWVGDIGPAPATPSPIWTKFLELPFDYPNGLNYTVGTSRWPVDWNFIQPILVSTTGACNNSGSTITFNLPATTPTSGTASLYLGIASDYYGAVVVGVNGTSLSASGTVTATPNPLPGTGFVPAYTHSDGSIREQASGSFSDERINFPASMLHTGTPNTITLSLRQIGGSYFANHFMYDYLRLELTGYVPPAPSSVVAYPGNHAVLVSWPVTPGATSYRIYRSTTNGSGYGLLASNLSGPVCGSGPGNSTYLDNTAVNGTAYYYVIQSINPTGNSANSVQSNAATPTAGGPIAAPATVSGLTTSTGNGTVTVNWNASPGANYYTVERTTLVDKIPDYTTSASLTASNTMLSTTTLSNSVTSTSFTDTSVTNGTKYAYTVLATNAVGTSALSTPYIAKSLGAAPAASPAGFSATAGIQQVTLNWSAVAGATGYVIQRGTKSGGPYTYVSSVSTLTYTDGGLAINTGYFYILTAVNPSGGSANSNEVNATTAPAAPTNFTATAGTGKVTLNWTAPAGAISYLIQRSSVSGGPYTILSSSATGTSFVDNTAGNGTTYYYVLAAIGINATGPNSNEASATPAGVSNLTWTGSVSSAWDTTTANWLNGSAAATYVDNSNLTFDDNAATTTVVISGTVSPNSVVFNNSTTTYNVTAAGLAGTGSVSLLGTGTLTISGINTYSGGTIIGPGTIAIGGGSTNAQNGLGTGPITFQGGTLAMNGYTGSSSPAYGILSNQLIVPAGSTGTLEVSQRGDSSGSLTGGGTLTLAVHYVRGSVDGDWSAFTGQLNVIRTSTGTSTDYFRINNNAGFGIAAINLGPYVVASSLLNASNSFTIGELSGDATAQLAGIIYNNTTPGNYTATYVVGSRNTDATFAGFITDGTSPSLTAITKTGTGTWTLSGACTYTGATLISSGTLKLAGSLAGTSGVTAGSGGTLNLTGGSITSTTVTIQSGGFLTGSGTITGNLTNAGTIVCGTGSNLIVNGNLTNTGFMQFTSGSGIQCSGTFTNSGTLDLTTGLQSLPAGFINNGKVYDSSVVKVQALTTSGNDLQFTLYTISGHNYQLQRTASLTSPTWSNVGSALPGSNANQTLTDVGGATSSQSFYRIVVTP
jgi:rhamnogalacturonan endolyase